MAGTRLRSVLLTLQNAAYGNTGQRFSWIIENVPLVWATAQAVILAQATAQVVILGQATVQVVILAQATAQVVILAQARISCLTWLRQLQVC